MKLAGSPYREKGATVIEYALLTGCIGLGAFLVLVILGDNINLAFEILGAAYTSVVEDLSG
jgi:Flp pilus assembly pilin Flp